MRDPYVFFSGTLEVKVKIKGVSSEYVPCTTVRTYLPTGYYFGISAATGGLSGMYYMEYIVLS
jgi:hypothetical protein